MRKIANHVSSGWPVDTTLKLHENWFSDESHRDVPAGLSRGCVTQVVRTLRAAVTQTDVVGRVFLRSPGSLSEQTRPCEWHFSVSEHDGCVCPLTVRQGHGAFGERSSG